MPILEVNALPQAAEVDPQTVSTALTEAVAKELGEPTSGTWVVWKTVDAGHYAEGAEAPWTQPRDTHPPLVRVIGFEGKAPELVQTVLTAIADTRVAQLGLAPGNAFVLWDEVRAGRLHAGGEIVGA